MEIKIECPWCNQHYSVDESFVGQKVECSVCEKEFVVSFPNNFVPKERTNNAGYYHKQEITNETTISQDYAKAPLPSNKRNARKRFVIIATLIIVFIPLCIALCVICYKTSIQELAWGDYKKGKTSFDEHRFEDAFKHLQYPASKGIPEAQFLLGMCYYNGDGIKQDNYEAAKWIRKAAEQGNIEAQLKLGVCYLEGNGVNQRDDEALYWLQKSAEQGNSEAQIKLGDFYYDKGEVIAFSEALKWYQKAGKTGEKERKERIDNCNVFVKATNGDAAAQIAVFFALTGGLWGVKEDLDEAKQWLIKAAESGSSEAQALLGALYYKADNKKEGVKWLSKAAEQGNDTAQYTLGGHYLVEKNYKEAIIWLRKAADQGNADAQYALGLCLFQEYGETSRSESLRWIQKAADQGNTDARDLLKRYRGY